MSKKITAILIIGLLIQFLPIDSSRAEVKEVEEKTAKAIQKKLEVQKMANKWINEKEAIINEMRQINNELKWYEFQTKKFNKYVNKQRQKLQRMKQEKQELNTMQLRLEPYLEEKIAHLENFIDNDLPFNNESRNSHIKYLQESLYDPDLSLPEKLRRVIKAYQREAKYGMTIGAEKRELNIKGKTIKAQIFRLGRLKLFYSSLDGQHIGIWNQKENKWEKIDDQYKRALQKAIDIANQQKAVELVKLPVGGLEE